jgi:hypothetical protein
MNHLLLATNVWGRTIAVAVLIGAGLPCAGQDAAQQAAAPQAGAPAEKPFTVEEIDQLVAPIALYPDPLMAQIFMASTYPLEIVEAARWQKANPDLKEKALEDALQQQAWDPSVKSLTAFPQVLTMMNEKLDWTQKLGDAFLAQQDDVMLSVQRLRNKAKEAGTLETTKEQKVIVEDKPVQVSQTVNVESGGQAAAPPPQTIVIQPADPQVVYVPTYNPSTAYGAWPYPSYPPYSYYPPGYVAATSMMSFGFGMMAGAALWGDCDWNDCCGGGGDNVKINVNNYNNFNKTDIKNGKWNHNVDHRKGVGYRDKGTQQRFGQGQRGRQNAAARDNFRGRADAGRQQMAREGTGRMNQQLQGRQGGAQDRAGARGGGQGQQQARRPQQGQRQPQARQQQTRQQQPQRRDAGAQTRQAGGARGGDAFRGMNSDRQQVQRQANRGRSSRQSSFGGSGRGGFGGGGGGRGGGRGGRR